MKKDNQNQDSKLAVYELAVLLDPKLSEDKVGAKIDQLGTVVAQESGAVLSTGEAKMRNLAYEITVKTEGKRRDFDRAYFNWIKFEQDPELLGTIEQKIKSDTDVIRHLIIKTTREDHITTLTDEYNPEDEDFDDTDEDEDNEAESDDGDFESDESEEN